jgi:hypothetical protein
MNKKLMQNNNNSKTKPQDPEVVERLRKANPRTRTKRKKKTVPPVAAHVNGDLPITVTTRRHILIDAVGSLAAINGYVLAVHGDPAGAACVHAETSFDLVPLDAERHGDVRGSWFWGVSIEDALVVVGHMDRDKPELLDDEVDKVALDA